jgi:hypothetical protein
MKSRNFLVALSKISRFSNTQEWCGYLTPSEAVALLDAGGIASEHYDQSVRIRKAEGKSKPTWFYFIPSKDIEKALGKRHV